ncbi:hypothetical protein ACFWNF_12610 [Streptomyces anulatus]|uniref:hypothetical protein n=1 Tax=Streptomyces anulatus TaxID=1892 RepID=UPI003653FB3F
MTEPIGAEHMRRLPWSDAQGRAEYASPAEGVDRIADSTEKHTITMARNDAIYALAMTQRPEVSRAELCRLVEMLAGHVRGVASVAEMREERLNSPAAKVIEEALRAALGQR